MLLRAPLLALLLAFCATARAEPGPVRLVVEPSEGELEDGRDRLVSALAARGVRVDESPAPPPPGFDPARLAVLEAVQGHLAAARAARARLEDAAALRELLAARAALEGDLALPGVARWLAEVELQLGLLAAQMGRVALAVQSFTRAAALDGDRRLAAAEAPPATLDLASRAAAELRQASRGRFEVEAQVGATVFVDDVRLGPTPRQVEVPPGRHVLRVSAPGHRTYATLLDVLPGQRPSVRVALAPSSDRVPRAPERRPGETPEAFAARVRAFSRTYPQVQVWWLHAASAPDGGPSLWRCEAGRCAFEAQWMRSVGREQGQPAAAPDARTPGRARRVAPWVAAAVVVVAGAALAASLSRRDVPQPQQVVTLDAGDLLR